MRVDSKFCLCSDPDYCLRWYSAEQRERAIEYRRDHGAPLPPQNDEKPRPEGRG